jgi:alpha-tubulin suppressor-like RCC1 family protein
MGQYHTLLLNNQGELFGLGCGSSGAVGTGATDLFDAPQKIKFGAEALNVVDFDAGKDFSVAVTSNGSVFTWGKSSTVPSFISELVARNNLSKSRLILKLQIL